MRVWYKQSEKNINGACLVENVCVCRGWGYDTCLTIARTSYANCGNLSYKCRSQLRKSSHVKVYVCVPKAIVMCSRAS